MTVRAGKYSGLKQCQVTCNDLLRPVVKRRYYNVGTSIYTCSTHTPDICSQATRHVNGKTHLHTINYRPTQTNLHITRSPVVEIAVLRSLAVGIP